MNKNKSPELSIVDRVVRYFAPVTFQKRVESKLKTELLLKRQYDAAYINPQSPIKRNSRSANSEVGSALSPIRNNVRELIRNAPFAKKGLDVIVNGTVGWGIEASISHPDVNKLQKINSLWKEWSGGLCSIDGKTDFYTLQNQVMSAVVADGESLVREVVLDGSVRLQVLESDYLNTIGKVQVLPETRAVNGVILDKYNRPLAYNIFDRHPEGGNVPSSLVSSNELIHVFRADRPGQNRGVSWFAPVVQPLNMLAELQWTHLVKMKLASAITAVVTSQPSNLSPELVQSEREQEWSLSPGDVKYIGPGEKVEFPTIPNSEGFDGSTKLALREIAAGLGITYEALSNDLSSVNFSSGRLGDLQFRANVDQWRWHMLIPRFCNPAFERFKKYCSIKGVDTTGISVEWTPPQRQMIDPSTEIASTRDAIRSGLQTLPGALRELGYDPKSHLNQISESNKLLDSLGIVLDSDPRRTGNQQLQAAESYQAIEADQKKS